MASSLPGVLNKPCSDCPWRRNAAPGWLGPFTAEEWFALAHSDEVIACHLSLDRSDGEWIQCAGAAIYRSNVAKSPRHPEILTLPADLDTVFGFGEFVPYHIEKMTKGL